MICLPQILTVCSKCRRFSPEDHVHSHSSAREGMSANGLGYGAGPVNWPCKTKI
jgi:hypothetical protein